MSAKTRSDAWGRTLLSGSAAGVLSGIALSACSQQEHRAPAAALNGPSQWLWGESEAYTRRATVRHTLTGYAIHHLASIFWARVHERQFGAAERSIARHCLEAGATAVTAYVVDYHLAPGRLRPGFKKHLGPTSLLLVYSAFAAGLALGEIVGASSLAAARRRKIESRQPVRPSGR
jgi:hypothetical protein